MFTEEFGVTQKILDDYGALNITLVCDLPLFIDPLLIFNSSEEDYQALHTEIIKYFYFLSTKAKQELTQGDIKTWFTFPEVKENWLGYSLDGNRGLAFGMEFANFLANHISLVVDENEITQSKHIEKIILLYKKSGRDKISDMVTNIVKKYFLEYTESFTKKYIMKEKCMTFPVDRAYFNYETESFVSREYLLPFIIKEGVPEYVLLTPKNLLRKDETAINRRDFEFNHYFIRSSITNAELKSQVDNYIRRAISDIETKNNSKKKKTSRSTIEKVEREAFGEIAMEFPELFDYYIKLKEQEGGLVSTQCRDEVSYSIEKFITRPLHLRYLFLKELSKCTDRFDSAEEESINRILYFKNVIEKQDGYIQLYDKKSDDKVANENDLQRMFKLTWYGTEYKPDFETNNGRGPADVVVSKGMKNQCVIEFKLASNPKLSNVFKQVTVYAEANNTKNKLIVICYFNFSELQKIHKMLKEKNKLEELEKSVFLIDCRKDNKVSASRV